MCVEAGKQTVLTYVLLSIALVLGGYLSYENLFHYEVKVEEHSEGDGHDHGESVDDIMKKADLDSLNTDLQLYAARKLHVAEKYSDSYRFYKRYEQHSELSTDVVSEMGTLFWKNGRALDAVKYFARAVKEDSTHVNSNYGFGMILFQAKEFSTAKTYLNRVVRYGEGSELVQSANEMLKEIKK